jgi:hypothetical protein
LAKPAASAQQAAALPPGEPAVRDAAVVLPLAAQDAAGAPQQAEVAAWVAAEAPQQEAAEARAGVAVRRPEVAARAGAAEVVRRRAALDAAAVLLRAAEAPDVQVVQRRAALPSAAAWAFHRDQALPWPAPQPAARFARAKQRRRIA